MHYIDHLVSKLEKFVRGNETRRANHRLDITNVLAVVNYDRPTFVFPLG